MMKDSLVVIYTRLNIRHVPALHVVFLCLCGSDSSMEMALNINPALLVTACGGGWFCIQSLGKLHKAIS
jgi:hypothetical protein